MALRPATATVQITLNGHRCELGPSRQSKASLTAKPRRRSGEHPRTCSVTRSRRFTPRFPSAQSRAYTAHHLAFRTIMKKLLLLFVVALSAASVARAEPARADLVSRVETCEAILEEFQAKRSLAIPADVWK